MGQKLNSEGKLPLPLGTKLLPIGGKGRPDEVHQIVGYKADIYDPQLYGYEVRSPDGEISFQAISNPRSGLREQRPDRVGPFTAALGPDGLEDMPFVPPQRRAMTEPEKPTYTQEEQAEIDKFYDDMGKIGKDKRNYIKANPKSSSTQNASSICVGSCFFITQLYTC